MTVQDMIRDALAKQHNQLVHMIKCPPGKAKGIQRIHTIKSMKTRGFAAGYKTKISPACNPSSAMIYTMKENNTETD